MSLSSVDPQLYKLCSNEKWRQLKGLELIASENFASRAVLQALSSSFHNKYSEGEVGCRYYGGNEVVDQMESLCRSRALSVFRLDPAEWGVNVQPLSGSPANFAVYTALVGPHGRLMGLDLPDGGHLTHGFQAASGRKVSASSLFFESTPYKVDPVTGLIDYDQLEQTARLFRPKLIIAGVSAYSRFLDYARFRQIADSVSAFLMADMAHVSGLVAAGLHPSPFDYCDVVTTTTHKTLRGPRGGMIFYRKLQRPLPGKQHQTDELPKPTDLERRINEAVFPGLQGGPHNNTIASLAVALKEASSIDFLDYQKQVIANMQALCGCLISLGFNVVSGGSDTHLCIIDMRSWGIDGARAEKVMDLVGISVNKNTCPGDKSALRPSGVRLGTPALTTRGFNAHHMSLVAELIHRAVKIAVDASKATDGKLFADFQRTVSDNPTILASLSDLRADVEELASSFPIPGFEGY